VLLREQLQTFDVPLDIQTGHLFRHADYDPDFSILFRGVESSPDMPPQDGNVEVAVGVSIGVVAAVAIAASTLRLYLWSHFARLSDSFPLAAGIFVIRKRRMTKVSKSIHERLAIDGGLGHSEAKTPAPTPDHGGVDEQEAGATGWSLGSKNVALKNTVSG
jgi:general stress protein CsbA